MHTTPPTGPDPRDVQQLTALLDLISDFPSNEQRARYLLTCNWMRDRGALAAAHARVQGKAAAAQHYAAQAVLATAQAAGAR